MTLFQISGFGISQTTQYSILKFTWQPGVQSDMV